MIAEVDDSTLLSAAEIHSESWRASHSGFCSEQFVAQHTVENQMRFLRSEMRQGKRLYLLTDKAPVGIVSVANSLIENLYVLPAQQHKGYGLALLRFAVSMCDAEPTLWILDNNQSAYSFYTKFGFRLTGGKHPLSDTISEVEMKLVSSAP